MQVFFRRSRNWKVWLEVELSQWNELHLSPLSPSGLCHQAQKTDDKKQKIESHIEEEIDEMRSKLNVEKGTKITKELFLQWKEERKKKKEREIEEKKQ